MIRSTFVISPEALLLYPFGGDTSDALVRELAGKRLCALPPAYRVFDPTWTKVVGSPIGLIDLVIGIERQVVGWCQHGDVSQHAAV